MTSSVSLFVDVHIADHPYAQKVAVNEGAKYSDLRECIQAYVDDEYLIEGDYEGRRGVGGKRK